MIKFGQVHGLTLQYNRGNWTYKSRSPVDQVTHVFYNNGYIEIFIQKNQLFITYLKVFVKH